MPRSAFMAALEHAVLHGPYSSSIKVLTNTACTSVDRVQQQQPNQHPQGDAAATAAQVLQVEAKASDSRVLVFHPQLLIGCDGLRSIVRHTLVSWEDSSHRARFDVTEYPSLSTGLRFKVMPFPPNPTTKAGLPLDNPNFALIHGQKASIGGAPLRLGLLPILDPSSNRTANLIALPDHPVWSIKDAETMYQVWEQSFPQIDVRALVPVKVCNCCMQEHTSKALYCQLL